MHISPKTLNPLVVHRASNYNTASFCSTMMYHVLSHKDVLSTLVTAHSWWQTMHTAFAGLGHAAFFFAFWADATHWAVGSNAWGGRLWLVVDGNSCASVFASTSVGFFTLVKILSALEVSSWTYYCNKYAIKQLKYIVIYSGSSTFTGDSTGLGTTVIRSPSFTSFALLTSINIPHLSDHRCSR